MLIINEHVEPKSSKLTRVLLLIAVACLLPGLAYARPGVAPVELVDALKLVFGAQHRFRANHANGLMLTGTFSPHPDAALVTRAVHFQSAPVPATVRFSNFGGNAHVPDADSGAAPYGMSVKFALPDGTETDLVMHSFNGFPSRTSAEFRDFLIAIGKSPAGGPRPSALESYAAAHERAKFFLDAEKRPPQSFASQPYFGVNTFKFIDAAGAVRFGRYRFVPVGAARYLDPKRAAVAPNDYLRVEIRERIRQGPVAMKLLLQLADQGDALDDPSIAWPEERRFVELGTLSISTIETDSAALERTLSFFPGDLPDGIEVQDPMLKDRDKAYAESIERRQR
ncbi:MAG: catalase family peroxidase [Pseudomonadota bacterium]